MFHIRVFGGALIEDDGAALIGPVSQRRRLALLALLATSTSVGASREKLAALLFPEADTAHAHRALSDALHAIRKVLGRDAIIAVGDQLRLNPQLVTSDVGLFEEAIAEEVPARAVALYCGVFLEGFFVPEAPEFEEWVEGTRARLGRAYARALEQLAEECEAQGDPCDATHWWRRLAAHDPTSSRIALRLMRALDKAGDQAGAIQYEESYQALLRRELDVDPHPEVASLAARIRSEMLAPSTPSSTDRPGLGGAVALVEAPAEPSPTKEDAQRSVPGNRPERQSGRSRWIAATAAGLVLLSLGTAFGTGVLPVPWRPARPSLVEERRPVVALLVESLPGADSAAQWMAASVAQMIADHLARASSIEVVPPEVVRVARSPVDSREGHPAADFDAENVSELARRLGATLVFSGSVVVTGARVVMDAVIIDAATGQIVRTDTWIDSSATPLADRNAAAILSAAGARGPGMRLTDVETASSEAYQHFARAMVLLSRDDPEGDRELDRAIALDSGFVSALHQRFRRSSLRNEPAVRDRLHELLRGMAPRATERDRLEFQAFDAFLGGEHERSEALARTLVGRFPRDPRGYDLLAGIYASHGAFAAAAQIALKKVDLSRRIKPATASLDALCAECAAYSLAINMRLDDGDAAGAVALASELTKSRPELPISWAAQAQALTQAGRFDEALAAWKRVAMLRGAAGVGNARTLISARRLEAADSAITALLASAATAEERAEALDARVMLERERGQFRAAVQTANRAIQISSDAAMLNLMTPGALARLGDRIAAERAAREIRAVPWTATTSLTRAHYARGWSWHAALAADALAQWDDPARLAALADSLEEIGRLSHFARDWRLHHHVRGLIHGRGKRHTDAAREFEAALFGPNAWTRTNVELSRAYLALGRVSDAINVLRWAYRAPLDAMGRYVPRSELDYHMSLALAAANQGDSAAAYAGYVRRAWREADPEIRRRTASLPY